MMQIAVVINNNGFFPCAPSLLAPTQGPVSATITIAPEVADPKLDLSNLVHSQARPKNINQELQMHKLYLLNQKVTRNINFFLYFVH